MESISYRYSSNLNIITELKYEVLLAVTMNSMVFWEGTPCRLEDRYVLTFDRILMHPSSSSRFITAKIHGATSQETVLFREPEQNHKDPVRRASSSQNFLTMRQDKSIHDTSPYA
jgi:hypothetical protein